MTEHEKAALIGLLEGWQSIVREVRREADELEPGSRRVGLLSTAAGIELCIAQLDGCLTGHAGNKSEG
jgi:hypothetical protein